jgi:L-threonylcarbamoyladenylate synthase
MTEKETLKLNADIAGIRKAGELIRAGGIVAFPTETVYGLGANALDGDAVKSVYEAKGRPSDNPMIVHIADFDGLGELTSDVPDIAITLMKAFWPGPITFVVKKADGVPDETTGGLGTVGIRMPANDIARALILASERPLAAPSANLSGRPSPTTYADVLEDMDGRIDAVIMGVDCEVGIESTVLDVTGEEPMILRPGYVTKEMIDAVLETTMYKERAAYYIAPPEQTGGTEEPSSEASQDEFKPRSPGMKYTHYSPEAEVIIVKVRDERDADERIESLRLEEERKGRRAAVIDYGGDTEAAAKGFFARLRELDRQGADVIFVKALDEEGLGYSVMNRMLRAAGYRTVEI